MSLTFFKNTKPDKRMIEYDQAVIRLGLEKAELEREVEKKRREVREISIAADLTRVAIEKDKEKFLADNGVEAKKLSDNLFGYAKRVTDEKKKLEDLVLNQRRVSDLISEGEKERMLLLESIEKHGELNVSLIKTSDELVEDKKQKEKERNETSSLLQDALREKNKAVSELYELNIRKSESERALEKTNKDLVELNEIIFILQATNRQGLDLVASFEGERKRLQEKDEFLGRKEKDLVQYEKRVEILREDAGNKNKMNFK